MNPELREIAQKWADHLAAEKSFEHSKTEDRKCSKGSTGENLFYSGSTGELEINGADAVESWYNEIKDYDFEKPGFAMNTGIFENNFSVDLFKIFNLLPESDYPIKEGKQSSFSRF